jgi:hypothetical protein
VADGTATLKIEVRKMDYYLLPDAEPGDVLLVRQVKVSFPLLAQMVGMQPFF